MISKGLVTGLQIKSQANPDPICEPCLAGNMRRIVNKTATHHMQKAIFVGYPAQYKGWEFYNPSTRKFVLSDRADFDERLCPGTTGYLPDQVAIPPPPPPIPPTHDAPVDLHIPDVPDQVGDVPHLVGVDQPPLDPALPVPASAPAPNPCPSPPPLQPPAPVQPTRHSTRVKTDPAHWQSNWFKSGYKSAADLQKEQGTYRDPSPLVPDSDSEPEDANFVQGHSAC